MPNPIVEQIQSLQSLPTYKLRALWGQTYRNRRPPRLSRELLLRGLAHRLQEKALGGLAPTQRRRLAQLATKLERDPDADLCSAPRIKPGTHLIRQWKGETHQVTVLEDGFAYRGQRYLSLSEIARTITGTRWSGPAFFGLKTRRCLDGKSHD